MLTILPVPQGEATGKTKEQSSEVTDVLREKATRQGLVRVIVKVRQDLQCGKTNRTDPQSECWKALEATKQDMLNRMGSQDFVQVESLKDSPLMVLEVTLRGLNSLISSDLLESIHEDVPERSF